MKKTDKTFFIFFFLYLIMLTGYYRNNKERLQKEAREIYQIFPEEEKNKKH